MSMPPPPPPDASGGPTPRRGAALVLLIIALIAQVLFLLAGVGVLLLGGSTGLELAAFLFVAGGVGWALLWLLGAILRQRVKPRRALLALVFALADVLIVVFLAAGSLGGSCSDRESMIIDRIAQYPGAPATFDYEPSTGSCAASLEVAASPEDVLAHYRGELESEGWTVAIEDVPTESEGETVIAKQLSASRGSDSFTIALESSSGHTSVAIRVDAD